MFNDHFFSFCIIRCYSPRLGMVSAPRTQGALRVSVFFFLFPKDDERGSIMLMGVQGLPQAAVAVKLMRNYDDHLSRCGVRRSNPTLRSRPEWRTRSRSISISRVYVVSNLLRLPFPNKFQVFLHLVFPAAWSEDQFINTYNESLTWFNV